MPVDSRLYTLDAMRGLAALLVVLYHLGAVAHLAPSGYLAVDFFFLLSGLVIQRSYAGRLQHGLPTGEFFKLRLVRLYPLFFVGLSIGLLRAVGQVVIDHPDRLSSSQLGFGLLFGLFLLPSPVPGTGLFPVNGPSWSLFLELLANLVFACALVRMSARRLIWVIAAFGVLLAATAWSSNEIQGGQSWATFGQGVTRVMFSFTLGVLLERVRKQRVPARTALCLLPAALLCGILLFEPPPAWRGLYDLSAAGVLFPLIVLAGARWSPPASWRNASEVLGDISYPVYIVHYPILYMASYAARKSGAAPVVWIPLLVLALAAIGLWLARHVDPKARRYLASLTASARKAPVLAS